MVDGQAYCTGIHDTFFLGDVREADGGLLQVRTNVSGSRVVSGELNLSYGFTSRLKGTLGGVYLDARFDDPQLVSRTMGSSCSPAGC